MSDRVAVPDPVLRLENIDKFYGAMDSGVHAVRNLSMDVMRGDIVALLGSSGCGKTSVLRMIAGFEKASRGRIMLCGRQIENLAPAHRGVAMAFEGYSLYPTASVFDNIAFALKAARLPSATVRSRVGEVAEMLEIGDILARMPNSISGGQQQRVSLARALVRAADLYLLDEPMGQLEPRLRTVLRGRVKHFIKERGLTAILVTHDQTEANALADVIAVMEDGVLQQYDRPEQIREQPANLFTGTFVGEPPMNVFAVSAAGVEDGLKLVFADGSALTFSSKSMAPAVQKAILAHSSLVVGVRPHAVHRVSAGAPARVLTNQWLGDQSHICAEFANGLLVLVEHERADVKAGDEIAIQLDPADLHVFDAESGAAISHGGELAS